MKKRKFSSGSTKKDRNQSDMVQLKTKNSKLNPVDAGVREGRTWQCHRMCRMVASGLSLGSFAQMACLEMHELRQLPEIGCFGM